MDLNINDGNAADDLNAIHVFSAPTILNFMLDTDDSFNTDLTIKLSPLPVIIFKFDGALSTFLELYSI